MPKKRKDRAAGAVVGEKPFLHIQLRAFAHGTEDPEKVRRAVAFAAGFDIDDPEGAKRFDKTTRSSRSEGHYRNPILILETELTRTGDVRRFWERLLRADDVRARLRREVEDRLDDDLVLWLRLDKQVAFEGGHRLTQGEDVIQVRAKLATYPKDRAVGLRFLASFLGDGTAARARPSDDKGH
jgi:RNA-binding protein